MLDTTGVARSYAAAPQHVLAAAEKAIAALGIPVEVDETRGLVGNLQIKTQCRFASLRMSQWLECGVRNRGPNADFYRIHMAIMGLTRALPDGLTELRSPSLPVHRISRDRWATRWRAGAPEGLNLSCMIVWPPNSWCREMPVWRSPGSPRMVGAW